jgi:catalase
VVSAEQAIAVINARFGKHPKFRALHAKGIVCRGAFTATPEAASLTRAAHMQGAEVDAIVRVSNGGGDPAVPDYAPDVRGLAVAFVARAAKAAGADYLGEELRTRLALEPVRFDLRVQIAEDGDETADPSAQWPSSRRVVTVGTLRIDEIVPEEGVLVFDPTSVIDGIELSDDPVLRFRAPAYSVSVDDRLA